MSTRRSTSGSQRASGRSATPRRPQARPARRTTARGGMRRTATHHRKGSTRTARLRAQARALGIRLLLIAVAALVGYLAYIYGVRPYTSHWRALYGEEVYPEGYSIRGIDISHHQGRIDWDQLSRAEIGGEPVSFVFIKATEGLGHMDDCFNDNFYQAREYGLLRGAYHYFKPQQPAAAQADWYLRQAHLEEGDLPPVLDIEETGGLSKEALREAALIWLHRVEEAYGRPPIIYTGYKFKMDYLSTEPFDRYPYWIAHYYVKALAYKGKWKFWQHTDCGRLPGIGEKVDFNIYNGSMYDLRKLCLEHSRR